MTAQPTPLARRSRSRRGQWTFLTHHARALLAIAQNREIRLRDLADQLEITERAAQAIVNDLVDAGYVSRTRIGRCNHYDIDATLPLRHPRERDHEAGELLRALDDRGNKSARAPDGVRSRDDALPTPRSSPDPARPHP